jgi:hypothetical protein
MKNKAKIFCLILVFMLINSSCAKRRLDKLEADRAQDIVENNGFDADSNIFYPENIDEFDVDSYLKWYKDLDKPPKLQLPAAESPKSLTNKEMVDDFNYVFEELKENYPFFDVLKREQNVDFIGNYNKYLKRVKEAKTDQEFIDVMTGIMGELNNHHARIADEAYVKNTLDYYSKNWNSPSIYYEFLNLNKQVVRNRYHIEGKQIADDGHNNKLAISKIIPNKQASNMTIDTSNENIAIIKINGMVDPDKFTADQDVLNEFLKDKELYKALIIDIRENYGGNMEYWQNFLLPKLLTSQKSVTNYLFFKDSDRAKLILADDTLNVEKLSNVDISGVKLDHSADLKKFDYYIKDTISISPDEKDKDNGFDGNIYLLVDKAVFSAAEGMASFMKNSESATLVGEKTGGDGITLGVINDAMPNSGLVFTYTNTLGYAPDGTINAEKKTDPDIQSSSFKDSIDTIEEMENGNF